MKVSNSSVETQKKFHKIEKIVESLCLQKYETNPSEQTTQQILLASSSSSSSSLKPSSFHEHQFRTSEVYKMITANVNVSAMKNKILNSSVKTKNKIREAEKFINMQNLQKEEVNTIVQTIPQTLPSLSSPIIDLSLPLEECSLAGQQTLQGNENSFSFPVHSKYFYGSHFADQSKIYFNPEKCLFLKKSKVL